MKPNRILPLGVLGTCLFAAPGLHAAARHWDGTDTTADADGGDGVWISTNTNWDTAATGGSNTTFGTNNQAVFGAPSGIVTLGEEIASGTITGNAASPNGAINFLGGTAYTITGGGTTRTITTGAAIQINGANATFESDVNFALDGALTVVNGGANVIKGVISGAHGVTKAGGGSYSFEGENSYIGVTQINQGVLIASSIKDVGGGSSSIGAPATAANGRIGLASGTLTATLRYTGGTRSSDRNFFLSGAAGSTGSIDQSGTGTLTLTGSLTVAAGAKTFILTGSTDGSGVFQGDIGGTAGNATTLIKNGSGTWLLDGAKIFTGPAILNAGVLEVSVLQNGGTSSGVGAAASLASNLILNGGTLKFTGAIGSTTRLFSLQSSSAIDASGSFPLNFSNTGAIGFNGGTDPKTLTLTGSNTGSNILAPVLGDNVGTTSVLKSGDGTWVLTGNNSYTGATTITGGTLELGPSGSISASASLTIAAGAALDVSAKTSYVIPAAQPVVLGINADGDGSSGTIIASGLDLEDAVVTFDITGTLDDPVYVLATYTNLNGVESASFPAPPDGYELKVSHESNKIALVEIIAGTPYEIWSGGLPADEDSNGDGVANGVAWALGADDPQERAIGLLPTLDNTSDETYLTFSYTPGNAAVSDENTSITVQYSTDLDGWTPAVNDGEDVIIGSEEGLVVVRFKRSALAPDGKVFARLKVVVTP